MPEEAQSTAEKSVDWNKLVAGALAGLSLMGAYLSSFSSGGASRSATRALTAEEQAAINAAQVTQQVKAVTISQEMMERARARASDMEQENKDLKQHDKGQDKRIAALEREIAAIEGKATKDLPHEELNP